MQTEASQAVIKRFFEAVDMLIEQKRIRGKQTFCNLYGIDKRNFYAQKKDLSRGHFQVSWLLPLINEYSVNSTWILTGRGGMFK
jgi:hypothetical protein